MLCGAVLLTVPSGAASAATLPRLPITGFTQILEAGNHLFLDANGEVVVTSLTGKLVATEVPAGAHNMATDGNTVFVALGDGVTSFSATTLKYETTYEIPPGNNLYSIAYEAGKIWALWGGTALPGSSAVNRIGYFDVGDPNLADENALSASEPWSTSVHLAADPNPTTEGTLVAIDNGTSPAKIVTFNVSGATPKLTPVAENDALTSCTGLSDFAVTPGGSRVILACTGGTTDPAYATATLPPVPAASYASGASPDAAAIAPDNSGTATGTDDTATATLSVFKADDATVTTVPLAADGLTIAPHGLVWSADATKLFAVLKGGANYYLDVLQYPQYKATAIDLGSTGTFPVGGKVHLKGTLALGGTPTPAGTAVKVFRQAKGSTATTTLTATTVAGGTFSLTDVPPAYGSYYYTAYYATNGTYEPAWHTSLVTGTALHTTLKLTTSAATVKAGRTVTVTAHLGATHTNRTVSIYPQVKGGAKKLIKAGKANSKGILAITYKVTKNTTFSVVFSGDRYYASATATASVKAQR